MAPEQSQFLADLAALEEFCRLMTHENKFKAQTLAWFEHAASRMFEVRQDLIHESAQPPSRWLQAVEAGMLDPGDPPAEVIANPTPADSDICGYAVPPTPR